MTLAWQFKPPVYQVDILNTRYDMMMSYQLPRSPEESMEKDILSGEWWVGESLRFSPLKIHGTKNIRHTKLEGGDQSKSS